MTKLKVVIPMAGAGSRFVKQGWIVPKPFIEFCGKMMVEFVMDSFRKTGYEFEFILIMQKVFKTSCRNEINKLLQYDDVRIVYAEKLTQGAACTVLLARDLFDQNGIIVADSDTFYDGKSLLNFINFIENNEINEAVLTFKSSLPCYSYINITNDGVLIAEKKVISEHAIAGVYYFSNANRFVDETILAMIYNDRDKSEFYMSKIFFRCARKNPSKVKYFDVNDEDIYCTGTPEQLSKVIDIISKK